MKAIVETLGQRIEYLLPRSTKGAIPKWPPDVFCICAAVLQASGAYSAVLNDNPPHGPGQTRKARLAQVKKLGQAWRKVALNKRAVPIQLAKWWEIVVKHSQLPLAEIKNCSTCLLALMNLLAAADEASAELGRYFSWTHPSDAYGDEAERLLFTGSIDLEDGATLCQAIPASKGRVLPKMHTPQNGLTIRSLSRNLAYTYSPDINPEWLSAAIDNGHHCFNLLAIPWPMKLDSTQFKASRSVEIGDVLTDRAYGLFTFIPSRGPSIEFVRSLVEEAESKVGHVDGIVFPELAMSRSEFDHLSQEFVTENRFLISGVGTPAKSSNKSGTNQALMKVAVRLSDKELIRVIFEQKKHHRWRLTKSQILQYGLASSLHPGASWWEHIAVAGRTLSFVTFRRWLTMSVLICEDLARPDPVGDVLRSVGPNLIIALLCDAPQLMSRWPGRYAGALADDPGSSVLTLTSLGASKLSKPSSGGPDKCRTIALWKDAKNGAQELELPEGASALLLSLSVEHQIERTADGRGDGEMNGFPVLAGVHPVYERIDPND